MNPKTVMAKGACVAIAIGAIAAIGLTGAVLRAQQATAQEKPLMSEQVFKNVQVLKGIPVDDFMETMGVMCASLQFDCSDCHTNAGTDKVDWAADTDRKSTRLNSSHIPLSRMPS